MLSQLGVGHLRPVPYRRAVPGTQDAHVNLTAALPLDAHLRGRLVGGRKVGHMVSRIAVLRSVAIVWPFGSGRAPVWLGGGGLEDQAGCDIGVCNERDVGAVDRLGDRAGALRHESLTVRRDRVVALGD